jgi:hypothetical protein
VAESKFSQYPFSPEDQAELASLEEAMDWQISFLAPNIREIELGEKILSRLQAGCKNLHVTEDRANSLPLRDVANFLAELSQCDTATLAKTVTARLRSLGIERRRPGRPTGRRADALYAAFVQAVSRAIERTGVLAKKAELRRTRGSKWEYDFTRYLKSERWPADRSDFLKRPATPQRLAIRIVSDKFNCSDDRVSRAVKAAKSVRK